jgi:hypothetical protein
MGLSPRTLRPANNFTPRSISGLALWLDASSADTLYTTDAGPVTAVTQPTDIAGCVGWWDASDAASITQSGGLVSQWNDKSTAGNHATASSTARPTTGTRSLNGKNVLDFDGTANAMATSLADAATQTVLFVAVSDVASGGRVWSYGTTNRGVFSDSGTWAFWRQQTSGPISFGATASATSPSVACALFTSNSSLTTFGNGAQGTTNDPVDSSGATFNIGKESTSFHNGYIAEIVIYNTALTTADRARVEAYLATKWGISGVHAQATASSDPVGYWADKSGNARHATQGTAGSRPTISAMGSRRALRLGASGAVSRLSLGNLSAAFPAAGNVFVAFQPNSDSQYTLYSTRNNDDTYANTSTSLWGTWVNTRTSVTSYRPSSGAHVANLYGTSGSFSVIEDGALIHSSSALTWEPGNDHNIGSRSASAGGQTPLDGWIGEVIAYNRDLTTAERQRLERYLAARWGITLAPQVSNADAQDWVNRVYANGGTVSSSTAAAVNTLCDSLDAASLRDRFYRLNLFCGTGLNAALVPLYRGPSLGGTQYGNTTDTNNAFVGVGTDYAETGAGGGLLGNGTSKYLNTGLTVSNIGTASSGHMSAYHGLSSGVNANRYYLGANDASTSNRFYLGTDSFSSATVFGSYGATQNATQSLAANGHGPAGHRILSRETDSSLTHYHNGSVVATNTTPITPAVSTAAFAVFAANRNGTVDRFHNSWIAAYSIGLGFNSAQAAAYRDIMQTFQTALGRNV